MKIEFIKLTSKSFSSDFLSENDQKINIFEHHLTT